MPRRLTPTRRLQWRAATVFLAIGSLYAFATRDVRTGTVGLALAVFAVLWVRRLERLG